ncbi:protein of unknown function [Devosia crocina]|uniref:DUF4336 domain-containing protein n=1 Tax=Devosia crocina TaxID=429728 RepID=A0A1I7MWL0_9HYPH|nr:DUF4336 domain-containing protein [Devosia crocina]SFV26827.1 protein of unknown function [Devosia crocina]
MTEVSYPPLDAPKAVAEGVWIVDSDHHMAGAHLPVRMTVLRLSDGTLLLHSPTRHTPATQGALEELGPIAHVVAPNTLHWSYMTEWQEHVPNATYWAVPGLRKRRAVVKSGLRLDRDLPDGSDPNWRGALDSILVQGFGISEAGLFHQTSRTLVLTDQVVNVEPETLPAPLSLGAKLVGAAAPHGKSPLYARIAFKLGGAKASAAARRLVDLRPACVIFSHGKWFEANAAEQLRESLSWLT